MEYSSGFGCAGRAGNDALVESYPPRSSRNEAHREQQGEGVPQYQVTLEQPL